MKKVSEWFQALANTFKSIGKVILLSHNSNIGREERERPLIIMANGPSLNRTISESLDLLKSSDTLSVNFAPLSDAFFDIKPKYHVLADPLFFSIEKPDNVSTLFFRLSQVAWPMTLLIPYKYRKQLPCEIKNCPNISIEWFNFVGAEGFCWVENILYGLRLAMPRPRNVLVPSLMCGIWLGYKEIFITGADHSWMQTIRVDEENNVISVQPHFYKDDKREQQRIDTAYKQYRLHDIINSFYIAFKSYHTLERYAKDKGVSIYNSTPDSFIDAFPRKSLPR